MADVRVRAGGRHAENAEKARFSRAMRNLKNDAEELRALQEKRRERRVYSGEEIVFDTEREGARKDTDKICEAHGPVGE